MKYKHLLIECYCEEQEGQNFPCNNSYEIGIHCLSCPNSSYSQCPNEIAISNDKGIVEGLNDFIGFGDEMEPGEIETRKKYIDFWTNICRKKIHEAYEEYMKNITRNKI